MRTPQPTGAAAKFTFLSTAPVGNTPLRMRTKRFGDAARTFYAHSRAAFETNRKRLRDHFNLLRKQVSSADKKKARKTSQEDGLSERDKILVDMVQAMEKLEVQEKRN